MAAALPGGLGLSFEDEASIRSAVQEAPRVQCSLVHVFKRRFVC